MSTEVYTTILSPRVSMSKVDEMVMLYNMSSAARTERSNALRTLRSSAAGRFSTMMFRRCIRCSDIPRAVEEETRKVSSGANSMLEWQREWKRLQVEENTVDDRGKSSFRFRVFGGGVGLRMRYLPSLIDTK